MAYVLWQSWLTQTVGLTLKRSLGFIAIPLLDLFTTDEINEMNK